jgi:Kef-type K+ transport system membrane component KefB
MDWGVAAIWLGLAVLATLISVGLRLSVALTEILVGVAAGALLGKDLLQTNASWVAFLAGVGSVLLTFLAGAELDPETLRRSWKEALSIGLAGFFAPLLGVSFLAHTLLGWEARASWLAGVALSTTSVAVVYAVMLELGLNRTPFGKVILAACFVNDLGTVLALGLLFAPFTAKTLAFALGLLLALFFLPSFTRRLFARYGGGTYELEAKFLLLVLFALGALAVWSGSEAVLPAYLVGMVLAENVGKDHGLLRRLRTLTLGLLTPFYFLRAGSLVSLPALGPGGGVCGVFAPPPGQDGQQAPGGLPGDPGLPVPGAGCRLHHPPHVHRPHLRHHFQPLRPDPRPHQRGPVLAPGGRRDRQRRGAHLDRQPLLPPPPPRGGGPGA